MMSHDFSSANGLFKTQTPQNGALFKGKTKTGYYFQGQHNIVWTDYLFLSSWVFKLLKFSWGNVCTPPGKVHIENTSHVRRKMTWNLSELRIKTPKYHTGSSSTYLNPYNPELILQSNFFLTLPWQVHTVFSRLVAASHTFCIICIYIGEKWLLRLRYPQCIAIKGIDNALLVAWLPRVLLVTKKDL